MLSPQCSAADVLAGPPAAGPSVICRVLSREQELSDRVEEQVASPLLTTRDNARQVHGFCCGRGPAKVFEGQRARAHFSFCPIWEEAERVRAARKAEEERVFPKAERPKLLGVDPEVEADILGIDPEQVPDRSAIAPETLTGVEAMESVEREWGEEEKVGG